MKIVSTENKLIVIGGLSQERKSSGPSEYTYIYLLYQMLQVAIDPSS